MLSKLRSRATLTNPLMTATQRLLFSSSQNNKKSIRQVYPQLDAYLRLIRFDKQIGSQLLLLPCFWGLFSVSASASSFYYAGLFSAGAFLARSAGCIINDLTDRDIDPHVERTKTRPLASGQISRNGAIGALALTMGSSVAILLSLNPLCILFGGVVTPLVFLYPRTKRFFKHPQIVLGLNFSSGVFIGQAALLNTILPSVALPLYFSGVLWTYYYDSVYAFQDIRDDKSLGLYSSAIEIAKFCEERRRVEAQSSLDRFLSSERNVLGIVGGVSWSLAFLAAWNASILNLGLVPGMGAALWQLGSQLSKFEWKGEYQEDTRLYWNLFESNKIYGLLVSLGLLGGQLMKKKEGMKE